MSQSIMRLTREAEINYGASTMDEMFVILAIISSDRGNWLQYFRHFINIQIRFHFATNENLLGHFLIICCWLKMVPDYRVTCTVRKCASLETRL